MDEHEAETQGRRNRGRLIQVIALCAIASAIGIALGLAIDWFPVQASDEARQIDRLWDLLLIVSIPVFVGVQVFVLYCVAKYRMRPGQENADGAPIHGNTRIEIIWTAIPAVVLVALCVVAYVVLDDIEDARADTMNVRVVGEQFAWTFYYPGEDGEEIASNQLYLPANRSVAFDVQSKDVIHDFWVPAFRMKIDAVPGETTHIRVTTTDRMGTYPVVCAELCGLGHAVMRQNARVVSSGDFDAWLAEQAAGDAPGGSEDPEEPGTGGGGAPDGAQLFTGTQPSCGSCHTLADAGTQSTIGPDLEESLQGRDEEYIRRGIVEPNADVAPGFQEGIMPPNYDETLAPEEVDALVDYLVEVTK